MAVYVDASHLKFGRMVMCHMLADTPEELHAMADAIGMQRKWFQGDASTPHYDVSRARRVRALKNGALEINRKDLVKLIRKIRAEKEKWTNATST